jgi:tryptophan-rich sensory protein
MNQTTSTSFFPPIKLRASNRSLGEQFLGLAIISIVCLLPVLVSSFLFSIKQEWYQTLRHAPWEIPLSWHPALFSVVHGFISLSFWTLWRSHSLRNIRPELSLFIGFLLLESIWGLSLLGMQEKLLALMVLLLWMSQTICCAALYWKKEKAAGLLLIPTLGWIFYLVSANMVLCIINP